ncbi:hypothetical protein GT037_001201 [Alternaria burnsii]|uniref:Uncharacterized protein n=1 Tax=Alternaria burnsii TaxID=1187904 RepID=A0A8H7EL75_9PLEO|nr:uncharacterized protein GT037_001201 [Alternaria burnsii]KAF7682225.1 hypothetical protein GT037_001201 [Alternaria burnsii]
MSSTKDIARTLPKKAPNAEHHRATLDGLSRTKFAIFYTPALDVSARQQLEESINTEETSTGRSKLAPQPDFSGRSLRDVYDCFIHLRDQDDTIHPLYFIVADQEDFSRNGVVVVLLNSSQDEEDIVGVGRCSNVEADSWGANIDIGNQDWLDLKEQEAAEWGGDDPYGNDDDNDGDKLGVGATTSQGTTVQSPTTLTEPRKKVYGWYSLVERAVPINSMLEPSWLNMRSGDSRFQMLGNFYSSNKPWEDIRAAHPQQCVFRPSVHRTLILVAEHDDANRPEGMTLARLKWDGDIEVVEDASPLLMPEVEIVAKVSAEKALEEADRAAQ